MKIRLAADELFYADGQTDRDIMKLKAVFHKFMNTPKKGLYMEICVNLRHNECCLTPTLSKHIWINTELQKQN